MLHTVLRRRANGETVEQIRPDLIIPGGRRKGQNPSVASIYRALAEHEKMRSYPDAVEQAHTEHAHLTGGGAAGGVRPRQDDGSDDEPLKRRLAQLPQDSRSGPPSLEKYDQLLTRANR